MKDTVVRDGVVRTDLLCADGLSAQCKSLGLS